MTSGGGLSTWNVEKIWTYSTVRGEAGRGMYIYIYTQGPRVQAGIELSQAAGWETESQLCVYYRILHWSLIFQLQRYSCKIGRWDIFI